MRIKHNATPFEVGDRVKLIERNGIRLLQDDDRGTIEHIGGYGGETVSVRWDGHGIGQHWHELLVPADRRGGAVEAEVVEELLRPPAPPRSRLDDNLRAAFG